MEGLQSDANASRSDWAEFNDDDNDATVFLLEAEPVKAAALAKDESNTAVVQVFIVGD